MLCSLFVRLVACECIYHSYHRLKRVSDNHSTLITSIIRLPFLAHLNQSKDPTWDVVDIATWSTAELGSAITTSCIPTTRPLISWLFPKFRLTSNNSADESNPAKPSFALGTIGSTKVGGRKNYTEITSEGRARRMKELGEGESEEYILSEDGRVIRQVVDVSAKSEEASRKSEV